jgi:hypothetical protein
VLLAKEKLATSDIAPSHVYYLNTVDLCRNDNQGTRKTLLLVNIDWTVNKQITSYRFKFGFTDLYLKCHAFLYYRLYHRHLGLYASGSVS